MSTRPEHDQPSEGGEESAPLIEVLGALLLAIGCSRLIG